MFYLKFSVIVLRQFINMHGECPGGIYFLKEKICILNDRGFFNVVISPKLYRANAFPPTVECEYVLFAILSISRKLKKKLRIILHNEDTIIFQLKKYLHLQRQCRIGISLDESSQKFFSQEAFFGDGYMFHKIKKLKNSFFTQETMPKTFFSGLCVYIFSRNTCWLTKFRTS